MPTLSYCSEPNSLALPWVDSPFFPQLIQQRSLDAETEALVRSYAENGYVVIDPQIADSIIDSATEELQGRFVPGSSEYYSDDRRVQDAWNFSDSVRQIAAAPRVLEILRILYQRVPFPFQTLNFRLGSEQRTHSDAAFFDSIPNRFMAGVWLAMEDIDEFNGPLRYYPGSHRLPPYNLSDLGVLASGQSHDLENLSVYEDFVEEMIAATPYKEERLRVTKGQALIWSANLYHGGSPIVDKTRTRFSQVTHYYFAGCVYYTPLTSDPGLGRLSPRQVFNVENGRLVPQYYHGRRVENPGEWPPRLSSEPAISDVMAFPTRVPRSVAAMLKKPIDRLVRRYT